MSFVVAWINIDKIKRLMDERALTFSGATRLTGLSRQTLYKLVHPEFDPFTRTFRSLAQLLGSRPEDLLNHSSTKDADLKALLAQVERFLEKTDASLFPPAICCWLAAAGFRSGPGRPVSP
jgi:hypothetical protein